jgi:hypothetical protein
MRMLVACGVLAAAAAAAASASGLAGRLNDFVTDEPAPMLRQADLQSHREVIVPRFEQQPESRAIVSKARGVLAIETSVGPVSLWVAPTRGGGECFLIDVQALPIESAGAACAPRPVHQDYVTRLGQSETTVDGRILRLIRGRVTPAVGSVEIRFADGESDEVQPAGGFFLRELRGDEEPVMVIARNRNASELARRPMPGPRSFRRDLAFPIGAYRTVIELESSAGFPMTFAVAPGTNGSVCERTIYRGKQAWGCGPGAARLEASGISVHRRVWNGVVLLEGSVGRAISRLEVWYQDGSASRIPIVEQYVLFEIPRDRIPKVLVGLDANGSIVARRPMR